LFERAEGENNIWRDLSIPREAIIPTATAHRSVHRF